jgi:hypothetical protein
LRIRSENSNTGQNIEEKEGSIKAGAYKWYCAWRPMRIKLIMPMVVNNHWQTINCIIRY